MCKNNAFDAMALHALAPQLVIYQNNSHMMMLTNRMKDSEGGFHLQVSLFEVCLLKTSRMFLLH